MRTRTALVVGSVAVLAGSLAACTSSEEPVLPSCGEPVRMVAWAMYERLAERGLSRDPDALAAALGPVATRRDDSLELAPLDVAERELTSSQFATAWSALGSVASGFGEYVDVSDIESALISSGVCAP